MTTKAKPITLLINSVDYSQYLMKAEVGYDSYSQGTGLILKKGSITIASISGGRALDPRDNNDFQVGNIVNIYYNVSLASPTAPHPIATVTRILAPPSVGPIESDLPVLEGNLLLEIPIGCELAYFKTKQADAESTGVTYGNPLNAQDVIRNLLLKAGISGANIGTSSIARFDINFPYNKNGGSFIDLAGEFAYSTHSGFSIYPSVIYYPSVLYCDRNNIIRQKLIKVGTNITYPLTITLGLNDREYLPQIDQSIAPGIVNISGIKRTVNDTIAEYPFTTTQSDSTPENFDSSFYLSASSGVLTIKTTTYYKNAPPGSYPSFLSSYLPPTRSTGFQAFKTNCVDQAVRLMTYNVYSGSIETTTTGGVATSQNVVFDFFNNDRLSHQISVSYVPIGSFYNVTEGQLYSWGQRTLIPSQVVCVGYKYNSDSSINVKETLTFKAPCVVNKGLSTTIATADQANVAYGRERTARLTNVKQETWEKVGVNTVFSESNYSAEGLENPTIDTDNDFFRIVPGRKTSLNDNRTTVPATVNVDGQYKEVESILNKSLTFGNGTNVKEYDIQIPFAWTETQLESIGLVEGTIINGRQYQYLIECDPDLLESYQEPLFGLKVVEPTKHRYFLCDALSWVHTDTEDYVGMAGIYMGTSDLAASLPGAIPQSMYGAQESSGSIVFGGHSIQFICTGVCY